MRKTVQHRKSSAPSRQNDVWPDSAIAAVRAGVPIQQVIAPRVTLRRAGAMLVGLCPFHDEKTPSFKVNTDLNTFHCFGCKAHGDAIDFLMRFDGLDFRSAVRDLAQQAGVVLPNERPSRHDGLYRCCEEAALWFESNMPEATRRFLIERRGLSEAVLKSLRIGFAPGDGEALIAHLRKRGLEAQDLIDSGLCQRREDGRLNALLRERVTFPITDLQGRVIAFGGRLVSGATGPKYLNTPNSAIFEKAAIAYGIHEASAACRKAPEGQRRILLVEGYFDVAALRSAGIAGVVAACGTSASPGMMRSLFRCADEVVVLFDPDGAGRAESRNAFLSGLSVLPAGKTLRVADVPGDLDPDEFVRRFGPDSIEQVVQSAPDTASTLLEIVGHDITASPEAQAEAAGRLAEQIAAMPASAYREILASTLARRIGLAPETFLDMVARAGTPVLRRGATARHDAGSAPAPIDILIQCALIHPGILTALPAETPWLEAMASGPVRARLLRDVRKARLFLALLDAIQTTQGGRGAPAATTLIDGLVQAGACTPDEQGALYAMTTSAPLADPAAASRSAGSALMRDLLKSLQDDGMARLLSGADPGGDGMTDLVNADLEAMGDAEMAAMLERYA